MLYLLVYPFTVSPEECSEYMLHALFEGERGFYLRGSKGENLGKTKYFPTDEGRKKLWEHTVAETTVASRFFDLEKKLLFVLMEISTFYSTPFDHLFSRWFLNLSP
jgi:hypothetical protein